MKCKKKHYKEHENRHKKNINEINRESETERHEKEQRK